MDDQLGRLRAAAPGAEQGKGEEGVGYVCRGEEVDVACYVLLQPCFGLRV